MAAGRRRALRMLKPAIGRLLDDQPLHVVDGDVGSGQLQLFNRRRRGAGARLAGIGCAGSRPRRRPR